MWNSLHSDLLAYIFSLLSTDSLATASAACRHWHRCAKSHSLSSPTSHHPPWFIAFPARNRRLSCYAHNPVFHNWHELDLDFLPQHPRPVSSIGSLILFRPATSTPLQLAICNPFTRQHWHLPRLNIIRTNPAVGVIELSPNPHPHFPHFRLYVAGGMSVAPGGGSSYEPTLEMYDSKPGSWQIVGTVPAEFAVRLTVWTPNESVYCDGFLYWMTSARAYSVMGFEIGANAWRELNVPLADRLQFAALARRNGKLTLVGGTSGGNACVWELGEGDSWVLIEKLPVELGKKFLAGKGNWSNTKCVGGDEAVCLYRELWSGMVVWREVVEKGRWEWFLVERCCSIRGKPVQNCAIRGMLIHPSLARYHSQ
ncbi:uncharacterized protein LOC131157184 [Malania oleifera]|uniref:uncharacterized protein LOC131157184 n=1 Tax=Malania oleifera TaxID=397392 RepID=UPI0025AE5022|nr:uncharacterized protein LOC131157184 [Malania oleifera]